MYTLLVTGDVPGASTYFNPLLQQTIIPCTSGTRPSSPPTGMHIYETDTGKLQKWNGSAWKAVASGRSSFTPALTATTTNPTLGAGNTVSGWYEYLSEAILYTFFIKFGTSGVSAGTGNYQVSVPVTGATPLGSSNSSAYGVTQLGDSSSGATQVGSCFLDPATGNVLGLAGVGTGSVGPTAPWAWAASDYISGQIIYPI